MNTTNKIEAVAATAVGAATWVAPWMAEVHQGLQLLGTILGIAWWIRIWLKDPNIKPPTP